MEELAGWPLAALTPIALFATACGGGGTAPQPGTSQAGGQAGGEITVYGCTPKNPLIPGNTNEACGSYIVVPITAKLIRYDVENASPINDIAESIETKRQQALHRQAQAVQVPRRHRGQGQELRRRLELHRVRTQRSGQQLLLRAGRRLCGHPVPRRGLQADAEGQDHDRPEGGR